MKRREVLSLIAAAPAAAQSTVKHTFAIQGDRFMLDGKPFVIRSGEMHYARIPREYWRHRMQTMRAMGLNTLCMYSFWNAHEPRPGQFRFEDNLDIAAFIRTAQEEGLWVIVRPGPYSCAEWEFGGFPSWLWETPGMKVRTSDPNFLRAADSYLKRLLQEVAPLQITRGGPVVLMQVENEYGSLRPPIGADKVYKDAIRKSIESAGIDIQLYTSDGSLDYMLANGTFPDLPSVVNFGGAPQQEFANFAKFRQNVPLMCGEYWCGWFDHWGEKHHTGDNKVHLAGIDWMLQRNISFNLYMVHGGTSFGYMAGANFGKAYQPDITSYDYDSPIDEAGRPAPKFPLFRDTIAKHLPAGESLPALPPALPLVEIPRFALNEQAPLFGLLRNPVRSEKPKTFESMSSSYGFVLYRTRLEGPRKGKLELKELRDYAIVFEGTRRLGAIDRRLNQNSLEVDLSGRAPLQILVENMGRINFGPKIVDDYKGITESVTIDGQEQKGWEMLRFGPERIVGLQTRPGEPTAPALHRGTFQLDALGDTFLDMRGWGKGYVWVNGRILGRYWRIGPQQTLFLPAPWLRKGENEVIVLDLEDARGPRTLAGVKDPVWDTPA
ncbi:MAG: beta-galactosidase [Acidobacteria bacterium]|nr:beta-galactosidase [Acidobacteriota bacterium]